MSAEAETVLPPSVVELLSRDHRLRPGAFAEASLKRVSMMVVYATPYGASRPVPWVACSDRAPDYFYDIGREERSALERWEACQCLSIVPAGEAVSSHWRRIRPDEGPWADDLAWPVWAEGQNDLLVFNNCDGFHVWRRNFSIPPGTWATTLREPSEIGRAHPVTEGDDKPLWVVRVMEAREEYDGEGFWEACSGCQESVDGQVSEKDYPYSAVFGCQPGGGCGACGGLGAKWNNTDYDAMARSIMADIAEEEVEADRARIAVEALEPFAKGAAHRTMPGLSPTYKVADFGDGVFVTVADFRRAAAARAALKSGSKS